VIVLDSSLTVQTWNDNAQELWGVRTDEAVGMYLFNREFGLPSVVVTPLLRAVLNGPHATRRLSVDASNRHGRPVTLHVTVTALLSRGDPNGVLVVVDAEPRD
jgi:two-component system CheB/CheR fusion protein